LVQVEDAELTRQFLVLEYLLLRLTEAASAAAIQARIRIMVATGNPVGLAAAAVETIHL
jgi:hypothetical protein